MDLEQIVYNLVLHGGNARGEAYEALDAAEEGDFEKAAQVLDKALAHDEPAPPAHRFQALVLRAAMAVSQDNKPLARTLLTEARQLQLADNEQATLTAEFLRADDLEKMLD